MDITLAKNENKRATFEIKDRRRLYLLALIFVMILGLVSGFVFEFRINKELDKTFSKLGFPSDIRRRGVAHELKKAASYLKPISYLRNIDLPYLDLSIRFKDLYKLYNKKNEAMELGYLRNTGTYVNGKLGWENGTAKVKLRLKGDMLDHLEGRKWSYRLKTKKSDHYKGMRVFSIQHPATRGYHWEPLFYEFLRELNLITPRYFFTHVTINGESIGIMAVEEHFSKEILESQNNRESVIIRFDEDAARLGMLDGSSHLHTAINAYIKPFQPSKVFKKPNLNRIYQASVSRIRSWLIGKSKSSEVFDLKKMALFIASCEVWNAEHGLWWTNMRFYINPVTMLLEPIAFDNESNHFFPNVDLAFHSVNGTFPASKLFQEKEFRILVHNSLSLIKEKVSENKTWERLRKKENKLREDLASEFPLIYRLPFEEYEKRLEFLSKINPEEMFNAKSP